MKGKELRVKMDGASCGLIKNASGEKIKEKRESKEKTKKKKTDYTDMN
ncbi:MAG: hypothetical protein GY757_56085 [bacterium]|nr:hypothetical protein [bacterium]